MNGTALIRCACHHYIEDKPYLKRVNFARINETQDELQAEMQAELNDLSGKIVEAMIEQVGEIWGDRTGTDIDPLDADDIEVPRKLKTQYRKVVRGNLDRTFREGAREAKKELPKRFQENPITPSMDRIQADKYLASKSFQITGIMDADVLKRVQNAISNGIKYNNTRAEIESAIDTILKEADSPLSEARIETIARTNISDAYNQARLTTFNDPALDGFVVAYEYSAILDSRTSEVCRNLDGKTSTDFGEFTPPNHFNCRSVLIPITEIDDFDLESLSSSESITSVPPNKGFGNTQQRGVE